MSNAFDRATTMRMVQELAHAVFDADNHLYETEDALTRHLPAEHANLFRFVEIRGRKKLVVRDRLTEFIPNPTFEVVARPGSHMAFYAGDNPEGKTLRELTGKPIDVRSRRSASPGPAPRAPRRAGHPRVARLPDAGEPRRGTAARRPRAHPGRDPRVQPVAVRRLDLRLRGSAVRHADREPVHPRRGHRRARAPPRSGRQGGADASGAGQRPARDPITVPPRVRSVLGPGRGGRRAGGAACVRQRLPGLPQHLGGHAKASTSRSGRKTFAAVADGGRSIQDALASAICHGMLTRFPGVKLISVENGGQLGRHAAEATSRPPTRRCPRSSPSTRCDVFQRNVWINPFWEDSVTGLIDLIGADRVCFGSDFPHPEGLEPTRSAWADELGDTSRGRRRARSCRPTCST